MSTADKKNVTVTFDPNAINPQSDIILGATPQRAGVMTAVQAEKLEGFTPGGGWSLSVTPLKTTNYLASDFQIVRCDPTGGGFTVTLPPAATATVVVVKNQSNSSNMITISRSGGDTIDGATSLSLSSARTSVTLYSDGISDWMVN